MRVSQHAISRFRQRCPGEQTRDVTATIFYEIKQGLAAHRRSTKPPSWCSPTGARRKNRWPGKVRFVWNEGETRCYALRFVSGDGGDAWVVMSTYARRQVA